MAKRFNSEKKIEKNGFKIKIGTTNRLNPNTVYIDLGGYIVPQYEKDKYFEEFSSIDKSFNKKLKNSLNKEVYESNFICVLDTAYERMQKGKKSYISMQCHLKQKNKLTTDEILSETENLTNIITDELINIIEDNGFLVKK